MSGSDTTLPAGFEALQPFVAHWALATADQRHRARLASSEPERLAFFEGAKDLLAPGIDYLDKTPLAEFSPQQQRLMRLLLALAYISLAVEQQGHDEPKHAADARFITITRAPSDA